MFCADGLHCIVLWCGVVWCGLLHCHIVYSCTIPYAPLNVAIVSSNTHHTPSMVESSSTFMPSSIVFKETCGTHHFMDLAFVKTLLPSLDAVSVGFFHDIFIPADSLQYPSKLYPLQVACTWALHCRAHNVKWLKGVLCNRAQCNCECSLHIVQFPCRR